MKLKTLVLVIFAIIFAGCSSKETINIDTKPKKQVVKKAKVVDNKKGSLYSRRGASLFSDKKDLQIGDIIQILISEELSNTSKNSKKTAKNSNTNIGGGVVTSLSSVNGASTPGAARPDSKLNGMLGLGFETGTTNSFTGSAATSIDEEFETKVSAIIEQTYINGNYLIKGVKEMLINGQKQTMKISGVIRPYDISPENTVESAQMANLRIIFDQDGDEAENMEKPWGSRILEAVSPF